MIDRNDELEQAEQIAATSNSMADGSQTLSGEVLAPSVTDTLAPTNGLASVLVELAEQGKRALGNHATGRILAAHFSQLTHENGLLNQKLEKERDLRTDAEKKLAVITAQKKASRTNKILGTMLVGLGPLCVGASVTVFDGSIGVASIPLFLVGSIMFFAGIFVPLFSGKDN